MPGAWCARKPRVQWQKAKSTRVRQVTPRSPGIPRAMVYDLFGALPGDRALLPPSSADTSANLTPASRRQDHTTSPSASAPFVIGASTSTASRPASVTIASRPSCGTGRAEYTHDLLFRKIRIFFTMGLDSPPKSMNAQTRELPFTPIVRRGAGCRSSRLLPGTRGSKRDRRRFAGADP